MPSGNDFVYFILDFSYCVFASNLKYTHKKWNKTHTDESNICDFNATRNISSKKKNHEQISLNFLCSMLMQKKSTHLCIHFECFDSCFTIFFHLYPVHTYIIWKTLYLYTIFSWHWKQLTLKHERSASSN